MIMLVFFAHHLAHSIQIDQVMADVEKTTLHVVRESLAPGDDTTPRPEIPEAATPLLANGSGYVQTFHLEDLVEVAAHHGACLAVVPMVGEHVIVGTPLGWAWSKTDRTSPLSAEAAQSLAVGLNRGVRLGFERTAEQDAAFGVRQLADIASKALSPAVNDPYTAVQAVDHLSVIFCALAVRPLGDWVTADPEGAAVIVPGRRFGDYLATMCGLIRRYGSAEPTLSMALLRLLENCAAVLPAGRDRWSALGEQVELIVQDAARTIAQPADLVAVTAAGAAVQHTVRAHLDQ